uniref:SOCS box domain-containing protein n=1 Tax=Ditylenchus dipsaci TaxID=166011 RepID=A0A915DCZ9_9BILA
MQICEFYRSEGTGHFQYFQGSWVCTEKITDYGLDIEWTDLFGQKDNVVFAIQTPSPHHYCYFYLISQNYGLVKRLGCNSYSEVYWGVKMDWESRNTLTGETEFEWVEDTDSYLCIDRAGPHPNGGDISFLLYNNESKHVHCRLEITNLRIVQLGEPFNLPSNEFSCMDLNGELVSGLDKSLQKINRFNVKTRTYLDSIQIYGLPPTIRCLRHLREFENDHPDQINCSGAWSNDQLFVWSEEKEGESPATQSFSTIYSIQLGTGHAVPMNHRFDQHIRRLIVSPDQQHLYIRNDKILPRPPIKCEIDCLDGWRSRLKKFRYFRVPLNSPESLFFLASMALPRPLTPFMIQLITRHHREEIPLQVYNRVFLTD